MDVNRIVALSVVVLSCVCISYQMLPDDVSVIQAPVPTVVANLTCIKQLSNGYYTESANCTNGRHIPGCCVDRGRCDYGTASIDSTMYAAKGYRTRYDIKEGSKLSRK